MASVAHKYNDLHWVLYLRPHINLEMKQSSLSGSAEAQAPFCLNDETHFECSLQTNRRVLLYCMSINIVCALILARATSS